MNNNKQDNLFHFKNQPELIDLELLEKTITELPTKKLTETIPEYSEKIRIFPEGSPFPGKHRFLRTPYAYEIAMELSPQSSTEFLNIEKAAQMGLTANTTESLILFKVGCDPGDILIMCPTEQFIKKWDESRIMPMLEASGLTNKLKSTYKRNSQHGGNGNTSGKKTWPGGRLDMLTFSQVNQLRNQSYSHLIFEDAEERVSAIKRGVKQGNFKKVAIARTMAYQGRRKILDISTPLILEGSTIHPAFLEGDQRYYYIKCPVCGHQQRLIWKNLKYITDDNKKIIKESVYYECEKNGCKILEIYKSDFLLCEELGGTAKWIPHNKEKAADKTKSWQISALYAGNGMVDWPTLAQEFVDAQGDPESLQTFINLRLGEPFADYSDSVPAEVLHLLSGGYKRGTLPSKKEGQVLYTMMGCDVQAGSQRNGEWIPGKEPRIEASLWGFGLKNRMWLIDHYVIKGATTDYRSGAFKTFREMIIKKEFPIMPQKIFMDSRYQTDEVKKFCNGSTNIFPIMGEARITEKGIIFRKIDLPNYRSADGSPLALYELKTGGIKRRIFNRFGLRQDPLTGDYPDGYMMFPHDIEHRFFEQMTAERPIPLIKNGTKIGYTWDAGGRSNEAFDCCIYAIFANEVFMYEISLAAGESATNERSFWQWAFNKFGKKVS